VPCGRIAEKVERRDGNVVSNMATVNYGDTIRHEQGLERHVDNIHYKPVKTDAAQRPSPVRKDSAEGG
jgi:hypothetical protein